MYLKATYYVLYFFKDNIVAHHPLRKYVIRPVSVRLVSRRDPESEPTPAR